MFVFMFAFWFAVVGVEDINEKSDGEIDCDGVEAVAEVVVVLLLP